MLRISCSTFHESQAGTLGILQPDGHRRIGQVGGLGQPGRWISHASLTVKEAHDLLRNLREIGVDRLRADLHEHMTHILH